MKVFLFQSYMSLFICGVPTPKLFQSDGVDPPVWRLYHLSFLWLSHMACGILIPQQGMESRPAVGECRGVVTWTTWEFSVTRFLSCQYPKLTLVLLFQV